MSGCWLNTTTASQFIATGRSRTVLVVGTEVLHPHMNWEDRTSCILFGDAAGAAIIERSEDPDQGLVYYDMGCAADKTEHIWCPAGGSRRAI